MNEDMTVRGGRLDWLLDDLVRRLAGSEKAVVLGPGTVHECCGLWVSRPGETDREQSGTAPQVDSTNRRPG